MQILRFVLLLVGSDAVRYSRSSARDGAELTTNSSNRKLVTKLYTFGAPKMAGPALADPQSGDGCFPGLRLVNKQSSWAFHKVDIVAPLLKATVYEHTKASVGFLYNGDRLTSRSCSWWGLTPERPSIDLHKIDLYVSRTARHYPNLAPMAEIALASSYDTNVPQVAKFIREKGGGRYGLVASAVCNSHDEVSHLIQDRQTLNCWLTFEGSDNNNDWMNNLKLFRTPFCGLAQQVHTGFRNCTMAMIQEPEFQTNVRPKLGKCRNIEVMGHSLGGSIAGLFTACAHSNVQPGQRGYNEFEKIYFNQETPQLMNFL